MGAGLCPVKPGRSFSLFQLTPDFMRGHIFGDRPLQKQMRHCFVEATSYLYISKIRATEIRGLGPGTGTLLNLLFNS